MANSTIYVYSALITAGATLTAGTFGALLAAYFQRARADESRRAEQVQRFRERVADLVIVLRRWESKAELAPVALGSPTWNSVEETLESEFLSAFSVILTDADSALTLAELTISDTDLLRQLAEIRQGLDSFQSGYGKIGEALLSDPKNRDRRISLVGPTLAVVDETSRRVDALIKMTQELH